MQRIGHRPAVAIMVLGLLGGCSTGPAPVVPAGSAAYDAIPEGNIFAPRRVEIGPSDRLSITVFREPDLSIDSAIVDPDGNIQVPLLGTVDAAGLTAAEFARDLERRFAARFLVDPSVTVELTEAAQKRVTVAGAVTQPGVYEIPGRISLVDAVALARGPTNVAKYDQVVVFRRYNGDRVGGMFDLGQINAGISPDIEILAGDQVIVGTDGLKVAYQDMLKAAPLLNIFQTFAILNNNGTNDSNTADPAN
ncbi:polysaccharide biosynthesis/export family protein [Parerythrobacter aestuarii]|uniref:polysaccharide biosynthesis/export family protein n=1 Tax=Parerythrobacter aestuarii TaxID=3020909 RepID=UPI0024DECBDE|nr:polysaccharide biosynthesis/export family protein [Parerythrobacter aestuarii]